MFNVRLTVNHLHVYRAVAVDVFDDFLFCAVPFFPTYLG